MKSEMSFKEQKEIYLHRLQNYGGFLQSIAKQKNGMKILEILLDPKTEKEIEYANSYLSYLDMTIELISKVEESHEGIDWDNSIFINYLTDYINAVTNHASKEELKKITEKYDFNDYKNLCDIFYETFCIASDGYEKIVPILIDKCGIDITDSLETMRLMIMMSKAQEELNVNDILSSTSEEDMDKFIGFTDYFRSYVSDRTKQKKLD